MNVYDFDETILWKDSTFLFFKYCLTHYPAAWKSLPATAAATVKYLMKKSTLEEFKEVAFGFLRYLPDTQKVVEQFWQKEKGGIKKWYLARKRPDDVVVSASPEFLLRPICDQLGVAVIGTRMDPKTGKITGPNCKKEEKVPRFRELYPNAVVEEFYSDSLSDTPLARIAQKSWLIDGENLTPWPREALNQTK